MADKHLATFENLGYEGNDVDLATSLFEYGLAWVLIDGVYTFIYGVNIDPRGNYISFCDSCVYANVDWKKEYDWADFSKVESYVCGNLDGMPLTQIITSLVGFYGYENVFGTPYYTFNIVDDD